MRAGNIINDAGKRIVDTDIMMHAWIGTRLRLMNTHAHTRIEDVRDLVDAFVQ
jgi:hypothetical protein